MAKFLCVDNVPNIVQLNRSILEAAGHDVVTCMSATAAIEELSSGDFDAVLTDWRLGDGTGRNVIEAARKCAHAPFVIVLSGFVDEAFEAPEPLADLYLEKPVDPIELLNILNELLAAEAKRVAKGK